MIANLISYSIKAKSPECFNDVALFQQVMVKLGQHHFRLPVRRFVIDLFDKRVLRQAVFEEDGDDGVDDVDGPQTARRYSTPNTNAL